MRSDTLCFQFFSQFPEAAFELMGCNDLKPQEFEFQSLNIKELPLAADGVYIPKKRNRPHIFLEVYFYKDKNAHQKLVLETLHFRQLTQPAPEVRMILIFATRKLNCGDKILDVLEQTQYFNVVYLDELIERTPYQPFFTLFRILLGKKNERADIERVQETYEELSETAPNYVDMCITALAEKYENLDYFTLKKMIDPTKPIDFSKSRLVNGYAQELVQEKVKEERRRTVLHLKENLGLTITAIASALRLSEREVEGFFMES